MDEEGVPVSQLTKLSDEQYDRLMQAKKSGELDYLVTLIAQRVIERGEQLEFIHFNEHGGIDLTRYEDLLAWLDHPTPRPDPSEL
jgi:hypothetical protein